MNVEQIKREAAHAFNLFAIGFGRRPDEREAAMIVTAIVRHHLDGPATVH